MTSENLMSMIKRTLNLLFFTTRHIVRLFIISMLVPLDFGFQFLHLVLDHIQNWFLVAMLRNLTKSVSVNRMLTVRVTNYSILMLIVPSWYISFCREKQSSLNILSHASIHASPEQDIRACVHASPEQDIRACVHMCHKKVRIANQLKYQFQMFRIPLQISLYVDLTMIKI